MNLGVLPAFLKKFLDCLQASHKLNTGHIVGGGVSEADQEIDFERAIADALEKILAPVVEVICEMERIRRKEYLTEKEAALLFSLSAATLKTQRSRGGGPPYIRGHHRILYSQKELTEYLRQKIFFSQT